MAAVFGVIGAVTAPELEEMGRRLAHRGGKVAWSEVAPQVYLGQVGSGNASPRFERQFSIVIDAPEGLFPGSTQRVVDSLLHSGDFFGFFIGNFHSKLIFQRHHQFDGVKRVGAEIVHKGRFGFDVAFGNTELLSHNLFDALFNIVHVTLQGSSTKMWAHFNRFRPHLTACCRSLSIRPFYSLKSTTFTARYP